MGNKTIGILGTQYTIEIKKYDEDEAFSQQSLIGYNDRYAKHIVVCDMTTYPGWENEPPEKCEKVQKETMRHEIMHAFLHESGLSDNTFAYDGGWAKNEEMIDWFAIQEPKIHEAFRSAGCK